MWRQAVIATATAAIRHANGARIGAKTGAETPLTDDSARLRRIIARQIPQKTAISHGPQGRQQCLNARIARGWLGKTQIVRLDPHRQKAKFRFFGDQPRCPQARLTELLSTSREQSQLVGDGRLAIVLYSPNRVTGKNALPSCEA